MSHVKHFDPWGYFFNDYGDLIGHDSMDVKRWVDAHPDYTGEIWFDYGTDEGQTACREIFYLEAEDESVELARVA